jgi:hypothetical protein
MDGSLQGYPNLSSAGWRAVEIHPVYLALVSAAGLIPVNSEPAAASGRNQPLG